MLWVRDALVATPTRPFRLRGHLGVGGMGEVWEVAHPDAPAPVAVKFLRRGAPAQRRSVAAFWNEVRAMAALDHPHILRLLDFGELREPLWPPTGEPLPEGCPFLVIELARGGDLRPWVARPRPWEDVRGVLLTLLDALAHAHARGVLHLDLKPANVLWCDPSDERPGLKLGDFGIAHLWADADPRAGSSGTPAYMAPEQLRGNGGRLGPWTDLYAVGVLAWSMLHGDLPPPQDPSRPSRGMADPLHPPATPVPADLYTWLERLLHRDPMERYRRAADAAWALRRAGHTPLIAASRAAGLGQTGGPTQALTRGTTWSTLMAAEVTDPEPIAPEGRADAAPHQPWVSLGQPARASDVPPLPPLGLGPAARPAGRSRGVGAALHGLRVPPLVGREPEQARLWEALVEAGRAGRARAVTLRGPSGFGKSRLLEWLAERSHEVGAAEVNRALHGPEGGRADGLWSMAARALNARDLASPAGYAGLLETLASVPWLSEEEAPTVARLLARREGPSAEGGRAPGAHERFSLLYTLLRGLSEGRVGLVIIDDAQWGREALEFVDFALRRQEHDPAPLLLALTVQEEALAHRPVERALLDNLLMRQDMAALEIGPLRVADWPRMVDAFLTLEPALAAAVAEGTQGNPLFTAQLLDDWVARGLLVATPAGYTAVGDATLAVPDDLARFWADRVAGALAGRDPEDRLALELAATLGAEVDPQEWGAVCALAGVSVGPDRVAALLEGGLARPGAGGIRQGWAFTHGLLRKALLADAEAGGRLGAHHARCAEGLESLGPEARWVRVGRHWLAAGRPERAIGPLGRGLDAEINHLPIAEARAVLALLERAFDEAGVAEVDLGRWRFRLHRCTVQRRDIHGRESMEAELLALEAMARAQGWDREVAGVLRDRAVLYHDLGRFTEAEAVAQEALALARLALPARSVGLANILGSLAMILLQLRRFEACEQCYLAAVEIYVERGELFLAGAATAGVVEAALQQDRLDEADARVAVARAYAERSGSAHARAEADALWAEVRRKRGDLSGAEVLFRSAIQGFQRLASSRECPPTVNLALTLVAQDRLAEARAAAERVLVLSRAPGAGWLEVHGHILLLAPPAPGGDWTDFDAHLARAEALSARDAPPDVDLARWVSRILPRVERSEHAERLARTRALSERLWRALGREPPPAERGAEPLSAGRSDRDP